jgi:hypothetical protein
MEDRKTRIVIFWDVAPIQKVSQKIVVFVYRSLKVAVLGTVFGPPLYIHA